MKNTQFAKTGSVIRKTLRGEKCIEEKRKIANFTLSPTLHDYLRMMACLSGESMSETVNRLIRQAIIKKIFVAEGKPLRGQDWCKDFSDNDLMEFYVLVYNAGAEAGYNARVREEGRG